MGDYYLSFAKTDKKAENSQNAKNYYQQSLNIWQELKQSDKLTEDYLKKPDEVKSKLDKCDTAFR